MKYLKLVYNTPQCRANKLIRSDNFSDPLRGPYAACNIANLQQHHRTVKVNFFISYVEGPANFSLPTPVLKNIQFQYTLLNSDFRVTSFFFFQLLLKNSNLQIRNCRWLLSYLLKYFQCTQQSVGYTYPGVGRGYCIPCSYYCS